jgi:hypothetical protein
VASTRRVASFLARDRLGVGKHLAILSCAPRAPLASLATPIESSSSFMPYNALCRLWRMVSSGGRCVVWRASQRSSQAGLAIGGRRRASLSAQRVEPCRNRLVNNTNRLECTPCTIESNRCRA